jgi:DNA-binding MarR family transcriptional regulator
MTDTPLSTLETHLGYWLRMVSNQVSHRFALKVEAKGVTVAEWVLLRELYDVPAMVPSHLAEKLDLTRGAISKLADRLENKGLVTRTADETDKRSHTLAITGAGRELVPQLAALADENDALFFGHLSPHERQTLQDILGKITRQAGIRTPPTG